jgi:hypothetical protein
MLWLWILGGLWLAWGLTALGLYVAGSILCKPQTLSWSGWWLLCRDLLSWRWWLAIMVVLPLVLVTVGLIRLCAWLGVPPGDLVSEE